MSSNNNSNSQSLATEQLLELLVQLKKTTPTAAKQILNAQPQIAYALITLMVSMNAINVEVLQRILADYSTQVQGAATTGGPSPMLQLSLPPVAQPLAAIPSHMQPPTQPQYIRNSTPPGGSSSSSGYPNGTSTPPHGYPGPYGPPGSSQAAGGFGGGYPPPPAPPGAQGTQVPYSGYHPPPALHGAGGAPGGYGGLAPPGPGPQTQQAPGGVVLPEALANIPEDQKAIIMRVLSMSPEQINMLNPTERATYIQLRATLGVPTN
ncbi:hypothetical protein AMATHDRAFT_42841 [Amanita thiersii Skay4041]|uniref:Cleavage stimulation factor subunit 2 hinge domain-containing protein n=1 Tax=Amanita thiersii Skay4041 TaxID=703135 RepID=A0A2A9NBZ4_9AGAR|nr:hypothetical protein AMATHDRAFT_42841 [Amanita thiersii Skay4041]